jgi:hypothetical protein
MKYNIENVEFVRELWVGEDISLIFDDGTKIKGKVIKPIEGKYSKEVLETASFWIHSAGQRPQQIFPFKNHKLISIESSQQASLLPSKHSPEELRIMKAFMTPKQRRNFNEGKQVGTLYHGTTNHGLEGILKTGEIGSLPYYPKDINLQKKYAPDSRWYVSFTRNLQWAIQGYSFIFVIDGDKLSNHIKIFPVSYGQNKVSRNHSLEDENWTPRPSDVAVDESEERVFEKLTNFKQFIKKVLLNDLSPNGKLANDAVRMLKQYNIPFEFIGRSKEELNQKFEINEGKQVGTLYHGTFPEYVSSIIDQNMLTANTSSEIDPEDKNIAKKYAAKKSDTNGYNFVSFTRNKEWASSKFPIMFVIDGDKLSNKYKIVPVDYFHNQLTGRNPLQRHSYDEFEERVFSKVKPLTNYLVKIIICPLYKFDIINNQSIYELLIQWANSNNIPIEVFKKSAYYDDFMRDIMKEGKQVGTLYHGTKSQHIISILLNNKLESSVKWPADSELQNKYAKKDREKSDNGFVSLTRNKNWAMNYEYVLVFDGNKLSNKYKIVPVDYFYQTYDKWTSPGDRHNKDEFEERIFSTIKPITKYLKGIIVNANQSPSRTFFGDFRQFARLTKKMGIPVAFEGKFSEDWQQGFETSQNVDRALGIKEGKQVGTLYHFTDIDSATGIVETNMILSLLSRKDNRDFGISFTRNKNFNWAQVAIVIDGDKLSNNYKIEPFNYFSKSNNLLADKFDEYEEKARYKSIKGFNKYIIAIVVDISLDYADIINWLNDTQTMNVNNLFNQCLKAGIPFYFGNRGIPVTKIETKAEYTIALGNMMDKYRKKFGEERIDEGKQVGLLYHYTSLIAAKQIMQLDLMKAGEYREGLDSGISFTRNKNEAYMNFPICFVVDGNKLSDKYKIRPYNYTWEHIPQYFDNEYTTDKKGEFEEKVDTNRIENFHKYLKMIVINRNRIKHDVGVSVLYHYAKRLGVPMYWGKDGSPTNLIQFDDSNKLVEGKQVGSLYHGILKFEHLASAIQKGYLKSRSGGQPDESWMKQRKVSEYTSFTRNRGMFILPEWDQISIVLEFDGNKLSHKYKIEPFNYFHNRLGQEDNIPEWKQSYIFESEERIASKINNFIKYLTSISIIVPNDEEDYVEEYKEIIKTRYPYWLNVLWNNNIPIYLYANQKDFFNGNVSERWVQEDIEENTSSIQRSRNPIEERYIRL